MKKIIYTTLFILGLFQYQVDAQDLQIINDLYYFDHASYNTAFIVDHDSGPKQLRLGLTSSLGGGVQDTKRFHLLAYDYFSKLELGVGLKVNTAFYGLFNYTTAETMYAKDFSINESHRFSLGLNFGLNYIGINRGVLNEYVQSGDPFLLENDFPEYRFTAGVGAAYQFNEVLHIGFAIPSLMKTNHDFRLSFVANAGYKFKLNDVFDIEPELVLYGTGDPEITGELNTALTYYDIFSVHAGYRTNNSWLFGFRWNRSVVKIGYIYQLNTGKFQMINTGIHNVNIFYVID
ncbi:MAG: hypothetical protein Sapg2KO_01170 [Saprospiraceae bacterium]